MMGSYDSDQTKVRWLTRRGVGVLLLAACLGAGQPAAAQAPPAAPDTAVRGGNVRLQLRVFDGTNEVTRDTRVHLYPAGRRSSPIRLTLGPDRAYEADVPVGLYDVQAIRSRTGPESIANVHWVERMLVQEYPDEYGRHLQVVHLREGFGALQIRPEGTTPVPAGWSAVATPPGTPATEVARARPLGPDLLLVVPAGTYDVKVTLPTKAEPTWITGIDIPDARTRLKTWPLRP